MTNTYLPGIKASVLRKIKIATSCGALAAGYPGYCFSSAGTGDSLFLYHEPGMYLSNPAGDLNMPMSQLMKPPQISGTKSVTKKVTLSLWPEIPPWLLLQAVPGETAYGEAMTDSSDVCQIEVNPSRDVDLVSILQVTPEYCQISLFPGTYLIGEPLVLKRGQKLHGVVTESRHDALTGDSVKVPGFSVMPTAPGKEAGLFNRVYQLVANQVSLVGSDIGAMPVIQAKDQFAANILVRLSEKSEVSNLALNLRGVGIEAGQSCHSPLDALSVDVKSSGILMIDGAPCNTSIVQNRSGLHPKSAPGNGNGNGNSSHKPAGKAAASQESAGSSGQAAQGIANGGYSDTSSGSGGDGGGEDRKNDDRKYGDYLAFQSPMTFQEMFFQLWQLARNNPRILLEIANILDQLSVIGSQHELLSKNFIHALIVYGYLSTGTNGYVSAGTSAQQAVRELEVEHVEELLNKQGKFTGTLITVFSVTYEMEPRPLLQTQAGDEVLMHFNELAHYQQNELAHYQQNELARYQQNELVRYQQKSRSTADLRLQDRRDTTRAPDSNNLLRRGVFRANSMRSISQANSYRCLNTLCDVQDRTSRSTTGPVRYTIEKALEIIEKLTHKKNEIDKQKKKTLMSRVRQLLSPSKKNRPTKSQDSPYDSNFGSNIYSMLGRTGGWIELSNMLATLLPTASDVASFGRHIIETSNHNIQNRELFPFTASERLDVPPSQQLLWILYQVTQQLSNIGDRKANELIALSLKHSLSADGFNLLYRWIADWLSRSLENYETTI